MPEAVLIMGMPGSMKIYPTTHEDGRILKGYVNGPLRQSHQEATAVHPGEPVSS